MTYKRIIANLLPYGLTKKLISIKKKNQFSIERMITDDGFQHYQSTEDKNIISVQGFGFSGSGAVIDLLREYQGVCVWGGYEKEDTAIQGLKSIKNVPFEMDILRHAGGLFDLEKIAEHNSIFINDAVIKRFIRYIDYFIGIQKDPSVFKGNDFKQIVAHFLGKIVDQRIATGKEYPYNPHLRHLEANENNYIYFLKQMPTYEYRNICASFLRNIFSLVEDKVLVLDQFLMDGELDYDRNKAYVPNHKIIMVYRDPRDVFATAIMNNVSWIPKTAPEFVKWYRILHKSIDKIDSYPSAISIRFYDLVNDYENTIARIESFLKIQDSNHEKKKWFFDPSISKKNIGLYKTIDQSYSEDINIIEKELSQFCY